MSERREAIMAALDEDENEPIEQEVEEEVEEESSEEVEEAEETEEAEEGDELEESAEIEEVEEAEEEPAIEREYPKSWRHDPELVDLYNKADQKLVDQIALRETQILEGIEQYKQRAEAADRYNEAISPYMATIQSLGVQPEQAVQHLLSVDHSLRYGAPSQKVALFQKLAQDYGVDISGIDQAEQPQPNPDVEYLQQQLQQLQQQTQQQQAVQMQVVNNEIASFATDKPYFEEVRNDMAELLEQGRATDLQDAYDKACWRNDEIRASLIAEQQKTATETVKQKAKQAVTKAKKAASSVKGSGKPSSEAPKGRRDMIADLLDGE